VSFPQAEIAWPSRLVPSRIRSDKQNKRFVLQELLSIFMLIVPITAGPGSGAALSDSLARRSSCGAAQDEWDGGGIGTGEGSGTLRVRSVDGWRRCHGPPNGTSGRPAKKGAGFPCSRRTHPLDLQGAKNPINTGKFWFARYCLETTWET